MNDRKDRIVQIVNQQNSIRFYELKQYFPDIADVTLRRDLEALSKEQRIIRFHGGVQSVKFEVGTDGKLSYRASLRIEEKRRIAKKAIEYIHPNTTIFIDSGSTCLELCKIFPDVPVLVFTSGIHCAMELCKRKHVQLYLLGGMVNKDTQALSGSTSLSSLSHLNFNTSFVGALGGAQGIFTTGDEEGAALKREVIRRSSQAILLTDSSKFSMTETFSFCTADQLDAILTDDSIDPQLEAVFKSEGANLILS